MSEPIDPAAVKADHRPTEAHPGRCRLCDDLVPCDTSRLASALIAEQAKTARVAELAHRFELVPRARLLGALTAKAKQ